MEVRARVGLVEWRDKSQLKERSGEVGIIHSGVWGTESNYGNILGKEDSKELLHSSCK